jgi:L-alanine-DL-glutamate epimerase-like enolase superfamily enzyme
MIITDVEALLLRQPNAIASAIADGSQDALIVRIHTDAGITGIGEVDSIPLVAKAIIEAPASHKIASGLRALLIGEDPLAIRRLWDRMYDGTIYFGRRGAAIHAISGVDIALWDIAGKAAGKPVHELLGGARRDRVKAYASTLMPETPAEAHATVAAQREAGFGAVKLGWGPFGRDPELDVALVAAARAGGEDDFDLMLDIGLGWSNPREAILRVRRMEEHRPYWIEEPFMPDSYAHYAALAAAVDTPIAAGEEESVTADFERLIELGDVAVIQPDVTRVGGISELLRIVELARARGRRLVPHSWSTGIIKAATLHVLAVMPEVEYFEYCVQTTELNQRLVSQPFPLVDGCVAIPDAPGLGVDLDEDVVRACLVA